MKKSTKEKILKFLDELLVVAILMFGGALMFTLVFVKHAKAEQVMVMRSDGKATVGISRYEINRIKLIEDGIKEIKYNLGELSVDKDKDKGEIYIRVTETGERKKVLSLFIISEKGRVYNLNLVHKKAPSMQISIKNKNNYSSSWMEEESYASNNNGESGNG